MTNEQKRKTDTFEILDLLSFDDYLTTNEVAEKLNTAWTTTLRRLFYLEYRGYVKFIEVRNVKKGTSGTLYAWRRLRDNEEKNTSMSKSFRGLLDFIPEDAFISTSRLSKITRDNAPVLLAKLLYLETKKEVVCLRPGRKYLKTKPYYWKKLSDKEKEELKDRDWTEIEKRYERECFQYSD